MPIINCIQRSTEWYAARCGKVTASRVCDVLARTKTGEGAPRKNYRAELVAETMTGKPADQRYKGKELEWRSETEQFARAAYELICDATVDTVGFVVHDSVERFGASPDGLIGLDGLLEVKVPATATHISYILGSIVPEEYQPQMLAQMACTGRQFCDFVSFDPRLPKEHQLFVRRFERDEKKIACMEQQVRFFLAEVDEIIRNLRESICIPLEYLGVSAPLATTSSD
ncbi:MAG: phage-related exonuclease [Candidatus Sulfotelmatobacter sp.]|nr:phage-related exonuclease [Candidatus Sulfotelmatobacter sp.]